MNRSERRRTAHKGTSACRSLGFYIGFRGHWVGRAGEPLLRLRGQTGEVDEDLSNEETRSKTGPVEIDRSERYWDRTIDLCRGPCNDRRIGGIPRWIKGLRLSSIVLLHGRFSLSDGHLDGYPGAYSGNDGSDRAGCTARSTGASPPKRRPNEGL